MKSNLFELTPEELDKELILAKEKIQQARFKVVTGNLTDTKLIKKEKKKIARIHTLKNEYSLGIRTR